MPPGATQQAIDGAVSLSGWFKRMYQLSVNAEKEVGAFRDARSKLVSPLPTAALDNIMSYMADARGQCTKPAQLLRKLLRGKTYLLSYSTDPYNSEGEVEARLFEMMLLVFCGFVTQADGRWCFVAYAEDDEHVLRACHRLAAWDDSASFEALRRAVPIAKSPSCNLQQDKADDASNKFLHLSMEPL